MGRSQTVDAYIEGFAGRGRRLRERPHALAHETVPQAEEVIRWGKTAWVHPSGTLLFVVAGLTGHANAVFTPSTRAAFEDGLAGLGTGEGSVRLPHGGPCRRTCCAG